MSLTVHVEKSCPRGVKSVITSQIYIFFNHITFTKIRGRWRKRYERMTRATTPFCNVYYTLEFGAAIRDHHVYQSKWTPTLDMKLKCEFDKRSEAAEYDENAIGVYIWGEEGKESGLVGHLPIELSKLLKQILDADKKNIFHLFILFSQITIIL